MAAGFGPGLGFMVAMADLIQEQSLFQRTDILG